MKTILRLSLILVAVAAVASAMWAVVQTGGAQNFLPAREEGNRPEFSGNFTEAQRPPEFNSGNNFNRERGERDGGGWRGLGTVAKNLAIFSLIFVAGMVSSNLITRWRGQRVRPQPIEETKI